MAQSNSATEIAVLRRRVEELEAELVAKNEEILAWKKKYALLEAELAANGRATTPAPKKEDATPAAQPTTPPTPTPTKTWEPAPPKPRKLHDLAVLDAPLSRGRRSVMLDKEDWSNLMTFVTEHDAQQKPTASREPTNPNNTNLTGTAVSSPEFPRKPSNVPLVTVSTSTQAASNSSAPPLKRSNGSELPPTAPASELPSEFSDLSAKPKERDPLLVDMDNLLAEVEDLLDEGTDDTPVDDATSEDDKLRRRSTSKLLQEVMGDEVDIDMERYLSPLPSHIHDSEPSRSSVELMLEEVEHFLTGAAEDSLSTYAGVATPKSAAAAVQSREPITRSTSGSNIAAMAAALDKKAQSGTTWIPAAGTKRAGVIVGSPLGMSPLGVGLGRGARESRAATVSASAADVDMATSPGPPPPAPPMPKQWRFEYYDSDPPSWLVRTWLRPAGSGTVATADQLAALERYLLEPAYSLVHALCAVPNIAEADELAKSLVLVFEANGQIVPVLKSVLGLEVASTNAVGTTFLRGNTIGSKMLVSYCRVVGGRYIRSTLAGPVQGLCASSNSFELDPTRLAAGENVAANVNSVKTMTAQFLNAILASVDECPLPMRTLCQHIAQEIRKKFPGKPSMVYNALGGFIFLRFFCPAIIYPEKSGLIADPPSKAARRGLILVSKILQNLANSKQFGSKEDYMDSMNQFLRDNIVKVHHFLEKLTDTSAISTASAAPRLPTISVFGSVKDSALTGIMKYLKANLGNSSFAEHVSTLSVTYSLFDRLVDTLHDIDRLSKGDPAQPAVYGQLEVLLLDNNAATISNEGLLGPVGLAVCEAIEECHPGDIDLLAQSLVIVFEMKKRTADLVKALIANNKTTPLTRLLSFDSLASKVLTAFGRVIGQKYLRQVLYGPLSEICAVTRSLELDPKKTKTEEEAQENLKILLQLSQKLFNAILANVDTLPTRFREMAHFLLSEDERLRRLHTPNTPALSPNAPPAALFEHLTSVSSFVFLGFFCPAIVAPERLKLIDAKPSVQAQRTLIMVTKICQHISNNSRFEEPHMAVVNKFLDENSAEVARYLLTLAGPQPAFVVGRRPPSTSAADIPWEVKEAAVSRIKAFIDKNIGKIRDKLGALEATSVVAYRTARRVAAIVNPPPLPKKKR